MMRPIKTAQIYLKTLKLPCRTAGIGIRNAFYKGKINISSAEGRLETAVRSISAAKNIKQAVEIALADGILRALNTESVQLYFIMENHSVRVAEIFKTSSPQRPPGPNDEPTETVRSLPFGIKINRLALSKSYFRHTRKLGDTHTLKDVLRSMDPSVIHEPKPGDRDTKPYILVPVSVEPSIKLLFKVKKGPYISKEDAAELVKKMKKPINALADKIRSERMLFGHYVPAETMLTQDQLEKDSMVLPSILSLPTIKDKMIGGQITEDGLEQIKAVIGKLVSAKASGIHLDIMDGQFVRETSTGPFKNPGAYFSQASDVNMLAAEIRKATRMPVDSHLMVRSPEQFIYALARAGTDIATIHAEENVRSTSARNDLSYLLDIISCQGMKPGLSINPKTPVNTLLPYLDQVSMVLLMSVVPGKGGQSFMETTVEKLIELKKLKEQMGLHFGIEVDGGINDRTIGLVKDHANIRVSGSFITEAMDDTAELARRIEIIKGGQ